MNQSKPRIVKVIVVSLLVFAGLFLTGRWLQGFMASIRLTLTCWVGSILQLASLLAPALVIVWLLVAYWRAKRHA